MQKPEKKKKKKTTKSATGPQSALNTLTLRACAHISNIYSNAAAEAEVAAFDVSRMNFK